jgi:hypothetical protein
MLKVIQWFLLAAYNEMLEKTDHQKEGPCLGRVAYTCNPSTQEAEARGCQVQEQT